MNTEAIRKELERLSNLAEKATPGPWDARVNEEFCNLAKPRHIWSEYGFFAETKGSSATEDAAYIAESRAAIPRLLACVEKLLGAVERSLENCPGGDSECEASEKIKASECVIYEHHLLRKAIAEAAEIMKGKA